MEKYDLRVKVSFQDNFSIESHDKDEVENIILARYSKLMTQFKGGSIEVEMRALKRGGAN